MPSIALLLSDPLLCRAVEQQVRALWTPTICSKWEEVGAGKFDALLADAPSLPQESSAEKPPLLFVISAAGDRIPSFDVTETFAKPLRLGHLVARLQWQWTAFQQTQDHAVALGSYQFFPRQKIITSAEEPTIKLTEKESALLAYLAAAPGPVSRDELLAEIWGYDGRIDTHTLETHVYRLRSSPNLRELILVKQGFYQINPSWVGMVEK